MLLAQRLAQEYECRTIQLHAKQSWKMSSLVVHQICPVFCQILFLNMEIRKCLENNTFIPSKCCKPFKNYVYSLIVSCSTRQKYEKKIICDFCSFFPLEYCCNLCVFAAKSQLTWLLIIDKKLHFKLGIPSL